MDDDDDLKISTKLVLKILRNEDEIKNITFKLR